MADELISSPLYNIYNLFHFGAYQTTINECNKLQSDLPEQYLPDMNILLYRSYLSLKKYSFILRELDEEQNSVELKAVKILTKIYSAQGSSDEQAKLLEELEELCNDGTNVLNAGLQILFSLACSCLGNIEKALKVLSFHPRNLECIALKIQLLLGLDRVDLAQQEFNRAKAWAEDIPLIQLIEAWVSLNLGGSKFYEASALFDELSQQNFGHTVKLINCRAAVLIHLGNYQDAEDLLLEALNKDGDDPDTLANLVVCADLSHKTQEVKNRYVSQLKEIMPTHPYLAKIDAYSELFDTYSQKITTT